MQKNAPKKFKNSFQVWQKKIFSNQIKNKYKLIFNQNKKKNFFFWDLVKKSSLKIENLKTGEPGRQVQSFQIFGKHYVGMREDIKTT